VPNIDEEMDNPNITPAMAMNILYHFKPIKSQSPKN